MRPLIAAVLLSLTASAAFAASPAAAPSAPPSAPALRDPVVVPVMGFNAKLEDGRVLLNWRRYKRGDFRTYILLKSADAAPEYPGAPALLSSDYVDTVHYVDGRLVPGTWHYRLCILTKFGDRWVSPVLTVVVGPEDVRHDPPTEADFE
jgi:hypothetical protein